MFFGKIPSKSPCFSGKIHRNHHQIEIQETARGGEAVPWALIRAPGGEMFFITDGCVLLNENIAIVMILLTYYIIAWWFSSSLCKRLPKGMF